MTATILPAVVRRTAALRAAFPTGVATARQLADLGMAPRTIYRRCLEGGPWRRLLPGIILLSNGRAALDQLLQAALLLGGPGAVITGLHACHRQGMRRGPVGRAGPASIAILVPAGRQVRSVGFVHVERTSRMPDPVVRDGFPLAPVVRAVLDAARRTDSFAEITEMLSDAVQRRLCTVAELAGELREGSRRGSAMPARVLMDVASGVRSTAERDARRLWVRAGMPPARWNVPIFDSAGTQIGVADCWVDEVALVWEIESTEWHLSPEAHDRTVERAARFVAAGATYTATKPKRLSTHPAEVIRTLRATYEQAAARPRPPLHAGPPRS